jgi:hypothetical protein
MAHWKHPLLWPLYTWLGLTFLLTLTVMVAALRTRSSLAEGLYRPTVREIITLGFVALAVEWLSLLAPLLTIPAVLAAKLDAEPSEGAHPGLGTLVRRPQLPAWAWWADTPDDKGLGMYEATVRWAYEHLGWRLALWYWLGFRNRLHGLSWGFGKLCAYAIDLNSPANAQGWRFAGKLWQFELPLGPARLLLGYKQYDDHFYAYVPKFFPQPRWAVPMVTLKRAIAKPSQTTLAT